MVSSFGPKYQQKIWQISALESKKWWNQQNKGTFLWYYNLHMILWAINGPLFYDLTPFQILGQKFVKFFVGIFVQMMTPKGHFEINWPLAQNYFCWQNTFEYADFWQFDTPATWKKFNNQTVATAYRAIGTTLYIKWCTNSKTVRFLFVLNIQVRHFEFRAFQNCCWKSIDPYSKIFENKMWKEWRTKLTYSKKCCISDWMLNFEFKS